MLTFILGLGLLAIFIFLFLKHPKFGKLPSGKRKERILASPNYRNGKFNNQSITPQLTGDASFATILYRFLFKRNKLTRPNTLVPHVKSDLHAIPKDEDALVWFGHSSYWMQANGKRFLVDPVFSNSASPISFFNKAFKGSNEYHVDDLPGIIDYLIITHDHWDHLDYPTFIQLKNRVKKFICSLGVGAHIEYWGIDKNNIIELDWNEDQQLEPGFKVYCLPSRHFSGRGFFANQSLWASFLLETPTYKVYIGGDSGYDTHFAEIGERFNGIDLAILENGQFDEHWKHIHMMPLEVWQAARDLKAKVLFPVHNSKFALANHDWDMPMKSIFEMNSGENSVKLMIPKIGEQVDLRDEEKIFPRWC